MNFKPMNNKIVLAVNKEEEKTTTGIILTQPKKTYDFCEVLAIDDKIKDIKVGDKLLISLNRQIVKINDIECYIADYNEILGKE